MHTAGQRPRASSCGLLALVFLVLGWGGGEDARGDEAAFEVRDGVRGRDLGEVDLDGEKTLWSALERPRTPGIVELRWRVHVEPGENAIELPVCAGRGPPSVDGVSVPTRDAGPVVVRLSAGEHLVSVRVTVSGYEKRVACGTAARVGALEALSEGLLRLRFASPDAGAGGGSAVAFVPPGHDGSKAGAFSRSRIRGTARSGRTPRTLSSWTKRRSATWSFCSPAGWAIRCTPRGPRRR